MKDPEGWYRKYNPRGKFLWVRWDLMGKLGIASCLRINVARATPILSYLILLSPIPSYRLRMVQKHRKMSQDIFLCWVGDGIGYCADYVCFA